MFLSMPGWNRRVWSWPARQQTLGEAPLSRLHRDKRWVCVFDVLLILECIASSVSIGLLPCSRTRDLIENEDYRQYLIDMDEKSHILAKMYGTFKNFKDFEEKNHWFKKNLGATELVSRLIVWPSFPQRQHMNMPKNWVFPLSFEFFPWVLSFLLEFWVFSWVLSFFPQFFLTYL